MDPTTLDALAEALSRDPRTLVLTGAGMSVDAGLPTYRGVGGLYEGRDTADGVPIEEALSGEMFRRRPEVTWRAMGQIAEALEGAQPHAGHRVLAALQEVLTGQVVVTQNVDGLHERAGTRGLIALHGTLSPLYCSFCGRHDHEATALVQGVPRCARCGGVLRPPVVLFGERLHEEAVRAYEDALSRPFDLVISIGTSGLFPYVTGPVLQAAYAGVDTAEIDPGETPVSHAVRWRVQRGAREALVDLARRLVTRGVGKASLAPILAEEDP